MPNKINIFWKAFTKICVLIKSYRSVLLRRWCRRYEHSQQPCPPDKPLVHPGRYRLCGVCLVLYLRQWFRKPGDQEKAWGGRQNSHGDQQRQCNHLAVDSSDNPTLPVSGKLLCEKAWKFYYLFDAYMNYKIYLISLWIKCTHTCTKRKRIPKLLNPCFFFFLSSSGLGHKQDINGWWIE